MTVIPAKVAKCKRNELIRHIFIPQELHKIPHTDSEFILNYVSSEWISSVSDNSGSSTKANFNPLSIRGSVGCGFLYFYFFILYTEGAAIKVLLMSVTVFTSSNGSSRFEGGAEMFQTEGTKFTEVKIFNISQITKGEGNKAVHRRIEM